MNPRYGAVTFELCDFDAIGISLFLAGILANQSIRHDQIKGLSLDPRGCTFSYFFFFFQTREMRAEVQDKENSLDGISHCDQRIHGISSWAINFESFAILYGDSRSLRFTSTAWIIRRGSSGYRDTKDHCGVAYPFDLLSNSSKLYTFTIVEPRREMATEKVEEIRTQEFFLPRLPDLSQRIRTSPKTLFDYELNPKNYRRPKGLGRLRASYKFKVQQYRLKKCKWM